LRDGAVRARPPALNQAVKVLHQQEIVSSTVLRSFALGVGSYIECVQQERERLIVLWDRQYEGTVHGGHMCVGRALEATGCRVCVADDVALVSVVLRMRETQGCTQADNNERVQHLQMLLFIVKCGFLGRQ
jgi:hypothetical protein